MPLVISHLERSKDTFEDNSVSTPKRRGARKNTVMYFRDHWELLCRSLANWCSSPASSTSWIDRKIATLLASPRRLPKQSRFGLNNQVLPRLAQRTNPLRRSALRAEPVTPME
jgi:hypothetical protein